MSEALPLQQAQRYLDVGRPSEALRVLSRHLASHPDDVEGLCLAALAYDSLEDHRQTLELAHRAASLAPDNEWPWRLIAAANIELRKFSAARKAALNAQRLAPGEWRTHVQLAQVALSASNIAPVALSASKITRESQEAAAEAVRLAPEEPDAHFVLGNVLFAAHKLKDAEEAFRRALSLNAQHAGARHSLSLVMLRRGKTGEAAAGFIDVLATDPNFRNALTNLRSIVASRLWWLHLFVGISSVIFFAEARSETHDFRGTVFSLIIVLFIGGFIVFQIVKIRKGSGSRFKQFAKSILHTDKLLIVWGALVCATYLTMILALIVPPSCSIPCFFITLLFLSGGVVVGGLRSARLARPHTL